MCQHRPLVANSFTGMYGMQIANAGKIRDLKNVTQNYGSVIECLGYY